MSGRSLDDRVDELIRKMSLPEKVGQTHQTANVDPDRDRDALRRGAIGSSLFASGAMAGNARDRGIVAEKVRAVQQIAVSESRLGIPLLFGRDVIHGHRTVFPIPLGLAATWSEELVHAAARTAADEAGADGINWTFAPMVDLCADPRWGRIAESFGEAPELAGRLAAASVRGFEQQPGGVASCAKHFVGYGLVSGGRDYDSVSVGENTLRNLQLRPFRAAVEAGCSSVMAAFIDVDGVPMHANRRLLRDVLKDEWGFEGVVVSDWDGVGELVQHGVAVDLRDAAAQAIRAGVDIDMVSGAYAAHLPELVESGTIPVELLDDAVRRILRVKFRRGLFEQPYLVRASEPSPSASSRRLAREAAASSFVLLSNRGVLPLDGAGTRDVLLTGPFVDDGAALLGTWTLDGRGEDVTTPAAAFADRLGDRLIVDDGRFSDRTLSLARRADLTIALVGEHPSRSGEANSISSLELPPGQLDLIRQLAALGKPLVVVVFTGRPLDLNEVLGRAGVVLVAWHPGIEAGPALADCLFGDVAPRGRLPVTFPRTVGHIPAAYQRQTGRPLDPREDARRGRYIDSLAQPRFPLGFGLTYTTFRYGAVQLSADEMSINGGSLTVSVDVTNVGSRSGHEVVQLYLRDVTADVTRPLRELADWVTLHVEPGQTATASFVVTPDDLRYYDRTMRSRVDPGKAEAIVGPNAADGMVVGFSVRP